jgi:DNA-binding transcriptional LysR family regulator
MLPPHRVSLAAVAGRCCASLVHAYKYEKQQTLWSLVMLLTVREMDVFRQVMEHGSITAAAAALHVSQPSVSKTLQQAEERLGFKLFTRERKRLIPTTEADALFPETVGAFAAIEVVQRLAGDLRAGRSGMLRLAVTPTLAHSLAPRAVATFQAARPEVAINLRVAAAREVARLVLDHRVDLGMILGAVGDARLAVRDLFGLPLGCVLPENHPLCALREIGPRDLAGHAVVSVTRHLPAGDLVARSFEDANVQLRVAAETNQSSVACALAAAGVGVAVLEGFTVMAAGAQGMQTRPFVPATPLQARVLLSRQRPLSKLATSFLDVLAEAPAV